MSHHVGNVVHALLTWTAVHSDDGVDSDCCQHAYMPSTLLHVGNPQQLAVWAAQAIVFKTGFALSKAPLCPHSTAC